MIERKLKIPYPIVVEGKYDMLRVRQVAQAQILMTDGFGVFRNRDKVALLKALSAKTRLLVLTDSDRAGAMIRAHLKGCVPADRLIQIYIPQIAGREKRKDAPSADGYLGVEGMDEQVLYDLLRPYEDETMAKRAAANPLSKADLYEDGLTGKKNSAARRDEMAVSLGLPRGMTPNAFLEAVRILLTYPEYLRAAGRESKP